MKLEIWHVDGSSFHFGSRGLGQEESRVTFPSDSLFAALVARLALLVDNQELNSFLSPFVNGEPPFLLTSVFPKAGKVLFFPNPLYQGADEREDGPRPKDLKKVSFLSEGVFREVISGNSLATMWERVVKYHNSSVLLLTDEMEDLPDHLVSESEEQRDKIEFWQILRRPRVTIERASSASLIYHTGQTVFNKDCGLWFGLQKITSSPKIDGQLQLGFQDLGIAGLGGERSSGFGKCDITPQGDISFQDSPKSYWVTLSRYLPKQKEMGGLMANRASYQLVTTGGWVENLNGPAQRRRPVTTVNEGSVLGAIAPPTPGQMVDVQPLYGTENDLKKPFNHPVWRNGYAVAVDYQDEKER